ncbi:elongation factor 2 [Tieghemostelium lacteum]|uniref:Elongation factor 2 n=1 Tax=Tieghemostelium lacteum TaxID=361077 RepID=A0A151ZE34_TIELA|nr:elongation factor 2 [Tieghemostelium lacteum]|eukprot:KYQ92197.1 elongation factor 2 [Tieghemostelium lacteum]
MGLDNIESTLKVEKVNKILKNTKNIRNVTFIAHVDHGRSTIIDHISKRFTDISLKASDTAIRIQSSLIPIHYELSDTEPLPTLNQTLNTSNNNNNNNNDTGEEDREFLINIVEIPPNFSDSHIILESTLKITDGTMIILDSVEGICMNTDGSLRTAVNEGILNHTLFINKFDRLILELQLPHEELYHQLVRLIENTNVNISTYAGKEVKELSPITGNVAFGSGLCGFGFRLSSFASIYASKFGVSKERLTKKLWGENYFCPDSKKWFNVNVNESGKTLTRSFCQFILSPLFSIADAAMKNDIDKITHMMKSLCIELSPNDLELCAKPLYKAIMRNFLPLDDSVLPMIIQHCPSPFDTISDRLPFMYNGPLNGEMAQSIMKCDPNGPLMFYVSKLISTHLKGYFAFGRVFSGTIKSGEKVRIFSNIKNNEPISKSIKDIHFVSGRLSERIVEAPAGSIVAISGIDEYINKTATVTTSNENHVFLSHMSTTYPIKVSVAPKNPVDLPKLVECLKKMDRAHSYVSSYIDEYTGEIFVEGPNEHFLEVGLNDLMYAQSDLELTVSDPIVAVRETITTQSSQLCLAKSPNKQNRLFCQSEPLSVDLQNDIENLLTPISSSPSDLSQYLFDKFQFPKEQGNKIWSFGPNGTGTNILTDLIPDHLNSNDIKDSIVAGFHAVTKEGILCDEPLRGVKFKLMDAFISGEAIRRGAGQIIPTARRVLYASVLTANPTLLQPIYLVDIKVTSQHVQGVYETFESRGGSVISLDYIHNTPLCTIKAHVPVLNSVAMTSELRARTQGQAFSTFLFDHWAPLDPENYNSPKVMEMIYNIREKKGLNPNLPENDMYIDIL